MKNLTRLVVLYLLGWASAIAQSNLPACQGSGTSMPSICFSNTTFTNGQKYQINIR
jgi:hypothetical protein